MKASLRRLSRAALLAVTLAAILPARAHVQAAWLDRLEREHDNPHPSHLES
jgi:hypothetical protein